MSNSLTIIAQGFVETRDTGNPDYDSFFVGDVNTDTLFDTYLEGHRVVLTVTVLDDDEDEEDY